MPTATLADTRRLAAMLVQIEVILRSCVVLAALTLGLPILAPERLAAQGQQRRLVETVGVVLRSRGFDSSSLEVSAGLVSIVVYNLAGTDLDITLDRKRSGRSSERIRRKLADKSRRKWKDVTQLNPGAYTIGVTGHPDWTVELVVTAN